MIEQMLKRENLRRYSLSEQELNRRWQAVRERMAERKIDYLVIQSQQRYVSGYFRWFTDMAGQNYHITAIFPREGAGTVITHGAGAPEPPASPAPELLRGGMQRINTPAMPNVHWEDAWDAEQAVQVMMRTRPATVGLVGLGNMSAALYENLKKGLTGVNVVNATDLVDEVRMVKSEEELNLHREAAYGHEASFELTKQAIRPGRNALEAILEIRCAQLAAGSEEQQISMTFGQPGGERFTQPSWGNNYVRRPFKDGDIVHLLIESSYPGGYWYDLIRYLCVGRAPAELQEAYEIAKAARAVMAKSMVPGSTLPAALAASDDFLRSKGCPPEARVGGHGQGLDLVERPIIHRDEPAKLEVGMVVSLHPTAKLKGASATIADTYVIGDNGAVPLYKHLFDNNELAIVG